VRVSKELLSKFERQQLNSGQNTALVLLQNLIVQVNERSPKPLKAEKQAQGHVY
jgi:hypothetical protein